MGAEKMHADEISTDTELVRRLLKAQFPAWAGMTIEPLASDGTANAIYRLGDDLVVRLPLQASPATTQQLEKEHRWLPRFAPLVPLAVPAPLAKGEPTAGYPGPWSVYAWIEGQEATGGRLVDPCQAAVDLAQFICALQRIDPTGGPVPGAHNFERGVPLAKRDARTREAIASGEGLFDRAAVMVAWETDRDAPVWDADPVWVHGDLAPGNLLARGGQLVAVIDWGGLGVGDPAIELLPAWNLFLGDSRAAFRTALGVDDATWARGRGLALSQALVALTYYLETNAAIVRWARRMIDEVLADHERGA